MDARTAPSAKVAPWNPERRNDGNVEIGVNYWNEQSQRMVFGSVSPLQYLKLWDDGLLKHTREGKPKPEHLPTREQVATFLKKEGAKVPPLPAPPPKRETVLAQPRSQSPSPKPVSHQPKPTPQPIQAGEAEIEVWADNISRLTDREREIARNVMNGTQPTGLTPDSAQAKFSGICSKVGLPTSNRFKRVNRRQILELVFRRYDARALMKAATVSKGVEKALAPSSNAQEERELLALFRQKSPQIRARILDFMRSI